ncbi:MAG: preprotein translocase subunit SecG [Paracoccaceae bacterium]
METVILTVHLILALGLIGVVLMQRSEGGGLGIGGGGGGTMAGRPGPTPLGKVTWGLAIAFICTSLALTIVAARDGAGSSVLDRIVDAPARPADDATLPAGEDLLPPGLGGADAPLVPQVD